MRPDLSRESSAGEFSRSERVGYQIQRELAMLIAKKANDPRLRGLTIAEVRINSDLTEATVYVTGKEPEREKETLRALGKASGFFRKNLARQLQMRGVPRLGFVYDHSFDQADRLLALIGDAVVPENVVPEK